MKSVAAYAFWRKTQSQVFQYEFREVLVNTSSEQLL